MALQIPTEIESERLLLRAPRAGDGAVVHAAVHESWDMLTRWMPWAVNRPTLEESEQVQVELSNQYHARLSFNLLLFSKESCELIGCSGIPRLDWAVPKFEIGYWVRTSAAGRGYVTEAVQRVTKFALEDLHAKRVEIYCDTRNRKSAMVAERAGFTLEGTLRNHRIGRDGVVSDTYVFAALPQKSALHPLGG